MPTEISEPLEEDEPVLPLSAGEWSVLLLVIVVGWVCVLGGCSVTLHVVSH